MSRYIVLGAVILNLALFSPCSATQAIFLGTVGPVQNGKPAQSGPSPSLPASEQNGDVKSGVVNIVVEKIESGVIHSTDGQEFQIAGSTRVIDNSGSHPGTRKKTAELYFNNGSLVQVVLR